MNLLCLEAEDFLDEKFVNKKEFEDVALENIKVKYGLDEIKDAFDEAAVSHQLDFFCGVRNENFAQACNFITKHQQ